MKNLHLIPTDKPSRLFLNKINNKLLLDSDTYCDLIKILPSSNYQHIYITNDEEIKEGNWYCSPNGIISKHNGTEMLPDNWKKIILTTDQDLIKDGVQAIDDEFLEWFVKNPTCEWVEVEDTCLEVKVCDCAMNENCLKPGYTIIIPQEESKQERMYSEEEMLLVLNIGFTSTDETWEECVAFAKEQFKKNKL
jgi:hypothetical protein